MIKNTCIFFIIILLSGCTLFKKGIHQPVKVFVSSDPVLPRNITNDFTVKYIGNVSDDEIGSGFLNNLVEEGKITSNVTLVNDESEADFTLKVVSLQISESSNTETINDPKSPYDGQHVMLNTVDCSATIKLIDNKNKNINIKECVNTKSRSEKLKNNRDVGDLLFGTNKDRTEYRTKLLSDKICLNLAQDVGRRIWVPITRRIANSQKK